ncbi:MAG: TIGR02391 family protein, partial [Kiloniellales bacterium]
MARRSTPLPPPQPANLSAQQIEAAIPKLKKRLRELEEVEFDHWDDAFRNKLDGLQQKVDATLVAVFGPESLDYQRYKVRPFWTTVSISMGGTPDRREWILGYESAITDATGKLQTAIDMLQDQLEDMGQTPSGRAVRALEGLDLHPAIRDAALERHRDGHYADAILASCQALNNLVQTKAARYDLDNTDLMRSVFSAKKPQLCFTPFPYGDKTDESEQEGMMHLYEGAM